MTTPHRTAASRDTAPTLGDWGEQRLIDEVILPTLGSAVSQAPQLGHDVAYICLPPGVTRVAVTADAAPRPLAWALGHHDFRTWGWYAVAAVVSDLATAGARPIGFTTSIRAPAAFLVSDLQEFVRGIAAANAKLGVANAGGNLRASASFGCDGTAIGAVGGVAPGRTGARAGDAVYVVGTPGRFMSAFLRARRLGIDAVSSEDRLRLLRPEPQLMQMSGLVEAVTPSAASDTSDGTMAAAWNIAHASGCQITLDLDPALLPASLEEEAGHAGINPWNLFFAWGDWAVVLTVDPDDIDALTHLGHMDAGAITRIGTVDAGEPGMFGTVGGIRRALNLLRNENFVEHSYRRGTTDHVEYLLRSPLWA